jgi:hypothetical protein
MTVLRAILLSLAPLSSIAADPFHSKVMPLIKEYCWDCHGDGAKKGGLNLDRFTSPAEILQEPKIWTDILLNVERHGMPPGKSPKPSQDQRDVVVGWIENLLYPVDCHNPDPGRVTLRRLNREEYNNTVRDLCFVTLRPGDEFPADDTGYGYDNIGDVLSLSPLLWEKYLAAAEKVVEAAIRTGPPPVPSRTFGARDLRGDGSRTDDGRFLSTTGRVYAEHELKAKGRYRLRVTAWETAAGTENSKMEIRAGDQVLKTVEVRGGRNHPETFTAEFDAEPGLRRLSAAFINDFYDPNEKNPERRDRNLCVASLQLEGPLDAPPPPLPESHRRLFAPGDSATSPEAKARKITEAFLRRAFRRPVTREEVDRHMSIYDLGRRQGLNHEASVGMVMQAALISPHFLFRGELQPEPDNPKAVHLINEHALAARLSYFLWSSMPDAELMGLADRGRLRTVLRDQVRRMIADPKSESFTRNFAGQWFNLRKLETLEPDPVIYKGFDDKLRKAMIRETELHFRAVLEENRPVLDFLLGDFTFVNGRLAQHYGFPGVEGDAFQRVSLAGTKRRGLLTQASILTLTSNPTRTSPVNRGKWVLETVLGTPPPPAPQNVPELEERRESKDNVSLRQLMEHHRDDPACASCHAIMDPIGFGLENFDGIGRWRDQDGNLPIKPEGELVTGESFRNHAELIKIFSNERRAYFIKNVARQLLTYGMGRGVEFYDKCALEEILRKSEKEGYRFQSMILAVVESAPFQKRRGDGARP